MIKALHIPYSGDAELTIGEDYDWSETGEHEQGERKDAWSTYSRGCKTSRECTRLQAPRDLCASLRDGKVNDGRKGEDNDTGEKIVDTCFFNEPQAGA